MRQRFVVPGALFSRSTKAYGMGRGCSRMVLAATLLSSPVGAWAAGVSAVAGQSEDAAPAKAAAHKTTRHGTQAAKPAKALPRLMWFLPSKLAKQVSLTCGKP
ncbi:hypothetical protein [Acetobacter orientalis]|uniref:hypothetical protein n=1 Tax=Acetobacter orientalis TaxID=146474 RepID=UPI00241FE9F0|nr:hypothetical protein [Acetobacter orientalis]